MKYSNVYIDAFGYELAPHVVSSEDLEKRLTPMYKKLHLQQGQLEALTGIRERRFWDVDHSMHEGAVKAGRKALDAASVDPGTVDTLIYGGVCRDNLEPATACAVAHGLGLGADTQVYDLSNACLGVMSGMVQIANAIELGQIKAGLVVSCESARQIIDITIDRILETQDMETFKKTVATLTGGSGAVGVLLTAKNFKSASKRRHRLLGGIIKNAVAHHELCWWGPDTGIPASGLNIMETDSVAVLKNGVALGMATFEALRKELNISAEQLDKIICHQVGSSHQKTILESIGIPKEKDFTTFEYLGNMGTVSLPITAAIADERDFLQAGDIVGFFGIGSGLNCLMLGIEW